jgi:hypothetical protein
MLGLAVAPSHLTPQAGIRSTLISVLGRTSTSKRSVVSWGKPGVGSAS